MKFTDHNLQFRHQGDVAVVTLEGTEANVQLLDESNFGLYRRRQGHRFVGGHYRSSPVRLEIPYAGFWHVVVDLGGFGGNVRSAVTVLTAEAAR